MLYICISRIYNSDNKQRNDGVIYLIIIYLVNRARKKKPRDIGAADNKILTSSKMSKRLRVKRVTISTERKPPSFDLH